jgi:chemotaxis response regulator CheB
MKRVYVLSRQSLFGMGIEALLTREADIEIIRPGSDSETSVECIETIQPDVVIIDCDDPEKEMALAIGSILQKRLGIIVIGLSLKDNKICVYRGEQKQVQQLDDLLTAIQS